MSFAQLKRGRRAGITRRFLVSLAAVALSCLILEGVFRALGYGNIVLYQPSAELGWEHRPLQQARTRVGRHVININSLGLRGPEVARAKPKGTIRILALGDSSTFGWGVRDEDCYPARLERALRERFPGRSIEVLNGGVNGYSLSQEHTYLATRGIELTPDLVILSHTWNESWNQPALMPDGEHLLSRVRFVNLLRRSAALHFLRDLRLTDLVDRFLDREWETDPPVEALRRHEAELRSVVDLAKERRIPLVFLSLASQAQEELTPIQQVMARVAAETGVPFVDTVAAFRAANRGDLFLDPVHPSPLGEAVLARIVEAVVIERVPTLRTARGA